MPAWLKLLTLLAAVPAWLFGMIAIVNGESRSQATLLAFLIFAGCTLLHIFFYPQRAQGDEAGGVSIDSGGD